MRYLDCNYCTLIVFCNGISKKTNKTYKTQNEKIFKKIIHTYNQTQEKSVNQIIRLKNEIKIVRFSFVYTLTQAEKCIDNDDDCGVCLHLLPGYPCQLSVTSLRAVSWTHITLYTCHIQQQLRCSLFLWSLFK